MSGPFANEQKSMKAAKDNENVAKPATVRQAKQTKIMEGQHGCCESEFRLRNWFHQAMQNDSF